jgi:hypothetical protein
LSDWASIESEIGRLAAASKEPFVLETIAHATELLKFIRGKCAAPDIAKGYWSTVRFLWDGFEIEAFDDHLELYHFSEGSVDIQYVYRVPGEPFPSDLIAKLPQG